MKKIVFVMPQLGGGGAERVVSTILKYLNKNKYDIYLVLIHDQGDYLKQLPSEIKKVVLTSKKARYALFDLYRAIKEINPDLIFSSLRGISLLISVLKPFLNNDIKYIFREDNTPSVAIKESRIPILWKLYYKTFFKRADYIICQSDFMLDDFVKNFNIKGDRIIRIYNPVDINYIKDIVRDQANPFGNKSSKNVVVVTRMAYQKGIDVLLNSIKNNQEKIENINIYILGNGKMLEEYKELSKKLEIDNFVEFLGRIENPFVWMKYADLFILPSRYEGLPNVLLEAASLGCEIITTNHPGGTREIMQFINREHNIVDELDWNPEWFENDKSSYDQGSLFQEFDVEVIIKKYEQVFDGLVN